MAFIPFRSAFRTPHSATVLRLSSPRACSCTKGRHFQGVVGFADSFRERVEQQMSLRELESSGRAARRARPSVLLSCAAARSCAAQGSGLGRRAAGLAGKDLNAVYFTDSKRGWVGGDGGLVLHTEDGGRTWSRQQPRDQGQRQRHLLPRQGGRLPARRQPDLTRPTTAAQTWRAVDALPAADLRRRVARALQRALHEQEARLDRRLGQPRRRRCRQPRALHDRRRRFVAAAARARVATS